MEPRRSGRATKPSTKLLEAEEEVELVEVRVIRRPKAKSSTNRRRPTPTNWYCKWCDTFLHAEKGCWDKYHQQLE